ncbi:MAG: arginine--tRNA ligase, partial [Spirochaetaceae bacterium]|nr:arginine--tRNA ligase [Spirochaetaceae bacterium]
NILKDKGLARESEGALVVFFDDKDNLHPSIVQTDDRQKTHIKQVFRIADRLQWNVKREHVYFGIMKFTDGHFSSRKGNVIYLSHLLEESRKRAFEIVTEKNPPM